MWVVRGASGRPTSRDVAGCARIAPVHHAVNPGDWQSNVFPECTYRRRLISVCKGK
ncbi:hypothetical protein BMASAVP1_1504 [Burkholderia mallei SAVP1]|nr:hypothetical protein BMASAVP1_1504 [Burkholderia mallei SAVP1]